MSQIQNQSIILKPYKNWFGFMLLIPILAGALLFITLFSMLLFFEKQLVLIPFLLITIFFTVLIVKQMLWVLNGETEIEITESEIFVHKKLFSKCKTKNYFVEDIEAIEIKNLFLLQPLRKIPVFGEIYLGLINSAKKDSESIVIRYHNQEVALVDNLTEESANRIFSSIKSVMKK